MSDGVPVYQVLMGVSRNKSKEEVREMSLYSAKRVLLVKLKDTRKDMTHSVISIDSILLNSMRNGKNVIFSCVKRNVAFCILYTI